VSSELAQKYPAGATVEAKYIKDHPKFAYLDDSNDTVDARRTALYFAAIDAGLIFLSYRLFKRVGGFSLHRFRR
jgi:hypothetical protein